MVVIVDEQCIFLYALLTILFLIEILPFPWRVSVILTLIFILLVGFMKIVTALLTFQHFLCPRFRSHFINYVFPYLLVYNSFCIFIVFHA